MVNKGYKSYIYDRFSEVDSIRSEKPIVDSISLNTMHCYHAKSRSSHIQGYRVILRVL